MLNKKSKGKEETLSTNKRYPDIVNRHRPGRVTNVQRDDGIITLNTENQVELEIQLVTDNIFHLRYFMEGDVRSNFSYAIDPAFKPDKINYSFKEQNDHYEISTKTVTCHITKDKLLVHFYDADGNILCRDKHGFYRRDSLMKGISEVKVTKEAPKDVSYFGMGDKACDQHLRGRAFENWCTDSYAYERSDDPLYRSIPFFMALTGDRAYGIFFDNTYRTRFSFDRKKNGVSSFSAEGGVMDYYFIHGPGLTQVAERYALLTGTPDLPPMWALGYHQCRWSYYPEERVHEVAQAFRDLNIPCDAIYLDIDYMDGYRCFTWNKEYFPHPTKMIRKLKDQGFKTIVMINPGIKAEKEYTVYQEGLRYGYFCRRPDGEVALAPVWPQKCAFPDFTHPETRNWWADLYREFMDNFDIDGVWNDMNEPAVFEIESKTFPDDIRHFFDGNPCSHKKAHNIYGMQMTRASFDGIRKHGRGKRPFLVSRANFSGGQRYSALWTGDNIASWDHLRLAHEQCLRLSISGYSFVGSDIGGFVNKPTGELFVRWLQLAVFHPLFRNHSMGYNVDGAALVDEQKVKKRKETQTGADQEPWAFGDQYTDINRATIELRYRLLGYLYSAFKKFKDQGTPILRPLGFDYQQDTQALNQNNEFLFGDHVLVAPVLKNKKKKLNVYLPEGQWYHFWDHQIYEGNKTHEVDAPIKYIPFFVKSGTVLPLREIMQYTGERSPDKLYLNTYYSKSTTKSELYEDSEKGFDYLEGVCRLTTFTVKPGKGENLEIHAARKGSWQPEYSEIELTLIGLPFEPSSMIVDGQKMSADTRNKNGQKVYILSVSPDFKKIVVKD